MKTRFTILIFALLWFAPTALQAQGILDAPDASAIGYRRRHSAIGGGAATATDNFSRADANPISNPMSDGVSTWTSGPGAFDDIKISSSKCTGVNGNWCAGRVASPSFAANQLMSITIQATSDLAPVVRMQSNGDCYSLIVANSTSLVLYKWDGGGSSPHSLITFTVSTLNLGDVVTLSVTGTTFTAKVNGVSQGTTTDSTYTSGQPGVLAQNVSNISLISATDL